MHGATDLVLRPCEARDQATLHRLWAQSVPADPLPAARFEAIVERVGFALAWLLEVGGEPRGFALAAESQRCGWLLGIGVETAHRRSGHGSALLRTALEGLAQSGCERVAVGGPGESYITPGLDRVAHPAAARLLERAGFRQAGSTFAMEAPLKTPRKQRATPPGVSIAPLEGDPATALEMIAAHLSPSWAEYLRGVGNLDERLLVAHDADLPIGFAAFDAFPGCPGRFGPMGVLAAGRGRGVGGALLDRALAMMAARGHRRAWFLWGPQGAEGLAMYRAAGFAVTRRFEFFSRSLGRSGPDNDQGGDGAWPVQ